MLIIPKLLEFTGPLGVSCSERAWRGGRGRAPDSCRSAQAHGYYYYSIYTALRPPLALRLTATRSCSRGLPGRGAGRAPQRSFQRASPIRDGCPRPSSPSGTGPGPGRGAWLGSEAAGRPGGGGSRAAGGRDQVRGGRGPAGLTRGGHLLPLWARGQVRGARRSSLREDPGEAPASASPSQAAKPRGTWSGVQGEGPETRVAGEGQPPRGGGRALRPRPLSIAVGPQTRA